MAGGGDCLLLGFERKHGTGDWLMLGGTGALLSGRWCPAFSNVVDSLCKIRAKVESVVGGTREDPRQRFQAAVQSTYTASHSRSGTQGEGTKTRVGRTGDNCPVVLSLHHGPERP